MEVQDFARYIDKYTASSSGSELLRSFENNFKPSTKPKIIQPVEIVSWKESFHREAKTMSRVYNVSYMDMIRGAKIPPDKYSDMTAYKMYLICYLKRSFSWMTDIFICDLLRCGPQLIRSALFPIDDKDCIYRG